MRRELEAVRDAAKAKLATGAEPPWAWYQYMKLVEAADAILAGMDATTTVNSPRAAAHPASGLRLVDATYQQDIAQRHPERWRPPLPM